MADGAVVRWVTLLTLVLAVACEDDGAGRARLGSNAPDAGVDAHRRASGTVDPVDQVPTMLRRFDPAGALRCDPQPQSASSPYTAPWPPWCADDGGDHADSGTPPEDCVAPCLWVLVKNCLPDRPCSPRDREYVYSQFAGHAGYSVCVAERRCLSYGIGGVPPTGYPRSWSWYDANGKQVAWGFANFASDPKWTMCGTCSPFDFLGDASTCAHGRTYAVNPDDPRCAPWRWLY